MSLFIYYSRVSILLFSLLILGCSKKNIIFEGDQTILDNQRISKLQDIIEEINSGSPQSFTLSFFTDAKLDNKRFKSTGKAIFNNEPRRMRISFHDVVFKSPLTIIVQEGEKLKFYFPIEKTLYLDNINTVNLYNYSNVELDYSLISDLVIGRIPLIEGYSIKGFKKGQKSDREEFIILENREYYETISFKNGVPDKILWLNKASKERTEVYLHTPFYRDNILFYKAIRLVSMDANFRITVKFRGIKFNVPIDLNKIAIIELPKRHRVINTDKIYQQ